MEIFEGAEKKCEVIVDSERLNLRRFSKQFWIGMVARCQATVLSTIHNEDCDAYLLSESSLFVWNDHFLLITCGQTKLVESILYFLEHVDCTIIQQLLFQRKNEYFAELQFSDFDQDVKRIEEHLAGEKIIFGDLNAHYTQLFHLQRSYQPAEDDQTYELLMYSISEKAAEYLLEEGRTQEQLRSFFRLHELLPHFDIDDFVFSPYGYSLNAISGTQYLTIHVTPQKEYSYVSLETNIPLHTILKIPLEILRPQYFDLIAYAETIEDMKKEIPNEYQEVYSQIEKLHCGYTVHFLHAQTIEDKEQS